MAFSIRLLTPSSPNWPASLGDLASPPARLHLIGNADLLSAPHGLVAIVGTRLATPYGERVADSLGYAFASAGVNGGFVAPDSPFSSPCAASAHAWSAPARCASSSCSVRAQFSGLTGARRAPLLGPPVFAQTTLEATTRTHRLRRG